MKWFQLTNAWVYTSLQKMTHPPNGLISTSAPACPRTPTYIGLTMLPTLRMILSIAKTRKFTKASATTMSTSTHHRVFPTVVWMRKENAKSTSTKISSARKPRFRMKASHNINVGQAISTLFPTIGRFFWTGVVATSTANFLAVPIPFYISTNISTKVRPRLESLCIVKAQWSWIREMKSVAISADDGCVLWMQCGEYWISRLILLRTRPLL